MERQPLILASSSPRRKLLLEEAGYEFKVIAPDDSVESGACSSCSPAELVAELAFKKAHAIAKDLPVGMVLAADTVAECQGQVLGKPRDVDHAEQMLRMMSGREHRVLTGICLWSRPDDQKRLEVETTTLQMAEIDEASLERHLDSEDWIGKAGAFGFQDGIEWVKIVEGNVSNVVGLPMERLGRMLSEFGFEGLNLSCFFQQASAIRLDREGIVGPESPGFDADGFEFSIDK